MNATEWLKQHGADIPAEISDTEGHLSLNYRAPTSEGGEFEEFGDSIESMDIWFIPNSGLYEAPEEATDPDADWLI